MPGAFKLDGAGLTRSVAAGDGRGTVGRTSDDLRKTHLPLMTIRQTDDDQAKVHKVGDDGEQCHLLTTMLGSGRGKGGSHFAVQGPTHPEAAGPVEEGGHLRRDAAVARTGAADDCIVVLQVGDRGDRGLLIWLE